MEIKILFTILIATIFINNYVLSQMLGLCPFLGVSKKVSHSSDDYLRDILFFGRLPPLTPQAD